MRTLETAALTSRSSYLARISNMTNASLVGRTAHFLRRSIITPLNHVQRWMLGVKPGESAFILGMGMGGDFSSIVESARQLKETLTAANFSGDQIVEFRNIVTLSLEKSKSGWDDLCLDEELKPLNEALAQARQFIAPEELPGFFIGLAKSAEFHISGALNALPEFIKAGFNPNQILNIVAATRIRIYPRRPRYYGFATGVFRVLANQLPKLAKKMATAEVETQLLRIYDRAQGMIHRLGLAEGERKGLFSIGRYVEDVLGNWPSAIEAGLSLYQLLSLHEKNTKLNAYDVRNDSQIGLLSGIFEKSTGTIEPSVIVKLAEESIRHGGHGHPEYTAAALKFVNKALAKNIPIDTILNLLEVSTTIDRIGIKGEKENYPSGRGLYVTALSKAVDYDLQHLYPARFVDLVRDILRELKEIRGQHNRTLEEKTNFPVGEFYLVVYHLPELLDSGFSPEQIVSVSRIMMTSGWDPVYAYRALPNAIKKAAAHFSPAETIDYLREIILAEMRS